MRTNQSAQWVKMLSLSWRPEFDFWETRGGWQHAIPESYLLTFIDAIWHKHMHKHTHKYSKKKVTFSNSNPIFGLWIYKPNHICLLQPPKSSQLTLWLQLCRWSWHPDLWETLGQDTQWWPMSLRGWAHWLTALCRDLQQSHRFLPWTFGSTGGRSVWLPSWTAPLSARDAASGTW